MAHALKLFLEATPGARVLVSAQSNFALDNIAEALLKRMPDQLMLREISEGGALKVADPIKPLVLENLARSERERIQREVAERLEAMIDPADEERPLLEEWLRQISTKVAEPKPSGAAPVAATVTAKGGPARELGGAGVLELGERIRAGASVVLATSSIASTLLDRSRSVEDAFDWVIIEEAAKAWPTEILIPLVLAPRWTLIGDHRQLGPHRAKDLKAFLTSLDGDDDDLVKPVFDARHRHLGWLSLFKSFFPVEPSGAPVDRVDPDPLDVGPERAATGRLNTLFRMHPTLAEPIRRVFYPVRPVQLDENEFQISVLKPDLEEVHKREHGLIVPTNFVGRPLIWVDTEGVDECRGVPYWKNEGEAKTVDRIVRAMRPVASPPDADDRNTTVVLTPYHRQRKLLDDYPRLKDSVFTVHSFQGREAHRVIVSLVRDQWVGDEPRRNVGIVAEEEVINVLLSRAQSLLILVGHFRHFHENAGTAWHWVTRIVDHYGLRVHASEAEEWLLE